MNSPDRTTPTVGELLNGTEGRDAIHFALCPVTAWEMLDPAERVVLLAGEGYDRRVRRAEKDEEPVGIIDPFLIHPVEDGQKCWLFVMPNTITSLRHIWTHPKFHAKVPMMKEKKGV